MEHEGDNYTNYNWCVWNSHKMITKVTGGLGSWRTGGDHPNYYIERPLANADVENFYE